MVPQSDAEQYAWEKADDPGRARTRDPCSFPRGRRSLIALLTPGIAVCACGMHSVYRLHGGALWCGTYHHMWPSAVHPGVSVTDGIPLWHVTPKSRRRPTRSAT